jgi:membrane-bound ClpP family serine protease
MKKLVGYVLAIAGLAVMVVGLGMISFEWEFLKGIKSSYFTVVSLILILVGVVLVVIDKNPRSSRKKEKQAEQEVPIYEGEGKNRKIVGYRRG